ncbi:hypothetical protein EDB81DRAFT_771356 [Dactylonectria macrodidyma]|uniref:Uncharacterized protein n=1 Tax=Dactylonectria macrodidyma TaxID=307937 RepID=A0A9P9FTF5_9HYPO|nr:hypothetical protein EDB81DRAFT_771356 [Dactylonectria macrodidyma]
MSSKLSILSVFVKLCRLKMIIGSKKFLATTSLSSSLGLAHQESGSLSVWPEIATYPLAFVESMCRAKPREPGSYRFQPPGFLAIYNLPEI